MATAFFIACLIIVRVSVLGAGYFAVSVNKTTPMIIIDCGRELLVRLGKVLDQSRSFAFGQAILVRRTVMILARISCGMNVIAIELQPRNGI